MTKSISIIIFFLSFLSSAKSQVCFAPEIYTLYSDAGQGIASADFDGDGYPDIVSALGYMNKIQLLKGLGTGSFTSSGLLSSYYAPEYVTSGDFNNDGNMDFAVNNQMYTATIFNGNGNFGFNNTTPSAVASGWSSVWITNADFNNDGIKDLALANETTNNVSVLLANTNFYGPSAAVYSVGAQPRSVIAADFNNDGNKDIASANTLANNVSILLGNGTGNFAPAVSYSTDLNPADIIADDFNNDGNIDIATSNCGPNTGTTTISVLLSNGQGGFNPAVNLFIGNYPYAIASGDFNGDNNKDIVVAVSFAQQLAVLLGNGLGDFLPPMYISLNDYPNFVITEDFNADGKDDIAIGHSYAVGVLLNTSTILGVSGSSTICAGGSATLLATNGGKNYLWNNGSTDSILVVSPLATTAYIVSSITSSNCTNSSILTVSVSTCLGLNNLAQNKSDYLIIYPNPATFSSTVESKSDMLVEISSFTGSLIKTIKLDDSNLHKTNLGELTSGIYFITGQTPSGKIAFKIIIDP